jgi:hypothetical protein
MNREIDLSLASDIKPEVKGNRRQVIAGALGVAGTAFLGRNREAHAFNNTIDNPLTPISTPEDFTYDFVPYLVPCSEEEINLPTDWREASGLVKDRDNVSFFIGELNQGVQTLFWITTRPLEDIQTPEEYAAKHVLPKLLEQQELAENNQEDPPVLHGQEPFTVAGRLGWYTTVSVGEIVSANKGPTKRTNTGFIDADRKVAVEFDLESSIAMPTNPLEIFKFNATANSSRKPSINI